MSLRDAISSANGFKNSGFNREMALSYLQRSFPEHAQQAIESVYDGVTSVTSPPSDEKALKAQPATADTAAPAPIAEPAVVPQTAVTFFESIALPLIQRLDVPVAPCYPGNVVHIKDGVEKKMGKTVHSGLAPSPLTMMSKDPAQIHAWGQAEPNANVCVYAQQVEGGLCFIDKDGKESLVEKYESETGRKFPETLLVCSSRLKDRVKGHWYFRQTPRTMTMGNISEDKTGGLFSFRVKNMYVASIGSIHPETGKAYTIAQDRPVIPMPDDLLDWLLAQVAEKPQTRDEATKRGRFGKGERYPALISELGRLWNRGYDRDGLVAAGLAWARANFEVVGEFNEALVQKEIEHYHDSYGDGKNNDVVLNQQPEKSNFHPVPVALKIDYPKFPEWVMNGTSIYEGFVKPYCEQNARVPFFMWLPCAAMMLNYLGNKVSIPFKGWKPSLYVFLIGRKGRLKKSSSIKDAMNFLEFAGVLSHYSKSLKNADGKTIVMEGGSAEGIGTDMQRINCKNVVLFWDEMSKLEAKANIQGAAVKDMLLKMYESNAWGNSVKTKKDAFNLEPGTYTASLITSTTTRTFGKLWGRLLDGADGLDSRSTLILEPETLPEMTPQHTVNFEEAALTTRKLIDRAVQKRTYEFFDQTPLQNFLKECGDDDRPEIRAEKWALYFAADLGLEQIDEDCVERGIELARYEMAVKKYVMTMEAKSDLAALQQDIVRKLSHHGGRMELGKLKAAVEAKMYDTYFWLKAYSGLHAAGHIVETQEPGKQGTSSSVVTLIRGFHEEIENE